MRKEKKIAKFYWPKVKGLAFLSFEAEFNTAWDKKHFFLVVFGNSGLHEKRGTENSSERHELNNCTTGRKTFISFPRILCSLL